ncbi:bactoprenol glucosyl transferase; CPS-53 (KpLE1) prophage [uncultured Alphaproteobacteria bacterium]|uniref:Bactoprenol glucosyl transferase CPS-53 (KpLE1) prophage n=1 Tax=uncultured Alphaproteobacteria bacterium TaxID=91750 RepID=A0A212J5C0_9PROT|nr:bactoprenol glucosyl transferase; CPS-53 (KpLE1) prophage [uncultured Alphaproteobacteria bacterium]
MRTAHSSTSHAPSQRRADAERALSLLSVVIPCYNESAGLERLYDALTPVLESAVPAFEIVLVDDGSRDDTFAIARKLAARDRRVKALRFARNFGKEAGMAAGLAAASGDAVVLMDADLQHPPAVIPEMLAAWRDGTDMVIAVRRDRTTDSWARSAISRLYYKLFQAMSEVRIPRGAGDFRLFDRVVVDAIVALPERNRFMKGITSWVGFRQECLPFDVGARETGRSAWNLLGLMRYAWDGLTSFSTVPLRVWSVLGVLIAGLATIYGLWLVISTTVFGIDVPGYASLMVSTLFLGGVQLISLGVLGEYVGRIFLEVKKRPLYLVADSIGFDAPDDGSE